MAKKKKTTNVGTISAMELIRTTRPMQDITFRTGSYKDKRRKREKVNRHNIDKYMQGGNSMTIVYNDGDFLNCSSIEICGNILYIDNVYEVAINEVQSIIEGDIIIED